MLILYDHGREPEDDGQYIIFHDDKTGKRLRIKCTIGFEDHDKAGPGESHFPYGCWKLEGSDEEAIFDFMSDIDERL